MSYWDSSGGPDGALYRLHRDTQDNEQDVYGRLEKVSGRTVALQSAATAAQLQQRLLRGEYTTQNSLDSNGSVRLS